MRYLNDILRVFNYMTKKLSTSSELSIYKVFIIYNTLFTHLKHIKAILKVKDSE